MLYLMNISQSQLEENIQLVRWERHIPKQKFSLLTIHSLLLDGNPKFRQLRQIIENYNAEQSPDRLALKQNFVERLFKMMSELTRIPNSENQLEFLNKIYEWAANSPNADEGQNGREEKMRPVTATTKARSQSAYSRATTTRPISGNFQKRTVRNEELPPLNKNDPKIDYTKLKDGEKEFYCGLRSLHSEYEHPKKRLKEYQRKVFYEEGSDSDVEVIDLEPKVEVNEKKLIQEMELAQEQEVVEGEGQGEMGQNEEAGDVNIDDIPIEGQEEPNAEGQPQEPQEIIDKLRPKIKVYNNPKGIDEYNHKHYHNGINELAKQRNYKERRVDEDVEFAQLGAIWAQTKGRAKSELKRRAESTRMMNQQIGVKCEKASIDPDNGRQNFINFQNVQPKNVNTKGSRPATAFLASNPKNRQQLIKNAFITGKLTNHVRKYQPGTTLSIPSQFNIVTGALTAHSGPPKKKTFEQILRQAEARVIKDSQQQVMGVKQTFAKNKITIGANRIAKSISYHDKQLPEQQRFTGIITGMTMLKNPFIKVAKKKKKKKKK